MCSNKLGLFLETGAAGTTGDGDLALAFRHTQLLFAVGTLEIGVIFVLMNSAAQFEPTVDGCGHIQELNVLGTASVNSAGHRAKQGKQNAKQANIAQKTQSGNGTYQIKYQIDD